MKTFLKILELSAAILAVITFTIIIVGIFKDIISDIQEIECLLCGIVCLGTYEFLRDKRLNEK